MVSVERGLQQTQGVDQPPGEAQLLASSPPQPRPLRAVLMQVELLLSLFADQLSLRTRGRSWPSEPPALASAAVKRSATLQTSLGMSSSTRMQSWSPPWRRKDSGMKEVSRDTCLLAWPTSIFLSSISMAWEEPDAVRAAGVPPAAFAPSDLGVGLRLGKLDLEIEHLRWRLLLQLRRRLLLTGQLSVHLLRREARG